MLLKRQWSKADWVDAGQGWSASGDTLRLSGWSKERRVIVMRRPVKVNLALETKRKGATTGKKQEQTELHLIDENEPVKTWEYDVLVCNTQYTLPQFGQLYRDRADCVDLGFCQNGFDEIKNQWRWGGYSTQDIERFALSAPAVAQI